MTEEKETSSSNQGTVDKWFGKLFDNLGKAISSFIAFLFILFTLGAVYGYIVFTRLPNLAPLLIATPAVIGLIAYYNRNFALVLFVALILGLLML